MKVNLEDVQQGVHLFHFGMSNCSQRVRICLSEKDIIWQSHLVNLVTNEHAQAWFQKINPKGLTPVLVHDGKIIPESIDIIKHLDACFSGPDLYSDEKTAKHKIDELLVMADASQDAIKLLTYEFLFKPSRLMMKLSFKKFAAQQGNADLVDFKRRFINNDFTEQEMIEAVKTVSASFSKIDNYFQQNAKSNSLWMLGDTFSLADIAWVVNVHRLSLLDFPLEPYPFLAQWYLASQQRECFQKGLVDYEPLALKIYAKVNRVFTQPKLKRLLDN